MSPTRSGQGAGNHWTPVLPESLSRRWAGSCHQHTLVSQFVAQRFLSWLLCDSSHKSHRVWICQAHLGCKSQARARQSRHVSLPGKHNTTSVSHCKNSTGNVLLRCAFHPWSNRTRPCSSHVFFHQLNLQGLARQKWNWHEPSDQVPSPSFPHGALSVVGSLMRGVLRDKTRECSHRDGHRVFWMQIHLCLFCPSEKSCRLRTAWLVWCPSNSATEVHHR